MTGAEFIQRRWVTDGAMATLLFSKGACLPVEKLNLTKPDLVAEVHREYLDAGAQILRTNTFWPNSDSVLRAGVRIAREVSQGQALVAGVIGAMGQDYRAHAEALMGVDLFILETFCDLTQLSAAVEGVRRAAGPDIAVIAQISVEVDGNLIDGTTPEDYGRAMNALAADVIGFNCSFGPASVMAAFKRMRTDKPLSASPNAGFKTIFKPDYMADYARKFLDGGALVVGTCCGSTPEHTRQVVSIFQPVL